MVSVHKGITTAAVFLAVFSGSAQYVQAQNSSDPLYVWATKQIRQNTADYKKLCTKLDNRFTEFDRLASELHFAVTQKDHGKNRMEQLSVQLDSARQEDLISSFDRYLGKDAPPEAEMLAQISRIKAKRKTVQTFTNEWVRVYNDLLARVKAAISDINTEKRRKKKLQLEMDSLKKLIDGFSGSNRGAISDDDVKKIKVAKKQAKKISDELAQSILNIPDINLFTPEVANVTDGAKKITRWVSELETDVTDLEKLADKVRKARNRKSPKRQKTSRETPPVFEDEPLPFQNLPVQFFGGVNILGNFSATKFSLNPGSQKIDLDKKLGWGLVGGVIVPVDDKFAVGLGLDYRNVRFDPTRLINPGGASVSTGGNGDVQSLLFEPSLYYRLENGITLRGSGYVGVGWRDIDLTIGGVSALKFSDKATVYGAGVGLGYPVIEMGIDLPNVCVNAGVDYMHYGSVNGRSPTNVPIKLGSFETLGAHVGISVSFGGNGLLGNNNNNQAQPNTGFCR